MSAYVLAYTVCICARDRVCAYACKCVCVCVYYHYVPLPAHGLANMIVYARILLSGDVAHVCIYT